MSTVWTSPDSLVSLYVGDNRESMRGMPAGTVQTCVTSPPYWWLRDYEMEGQFGLEATPEEYVASMVEVFRCVRRLLRDDGTLWLNLGDSYAATSKNRTKAQATNNSTMQGGLAGQLSILKQQSKVVAGLKPKDLVGIPWRVALALQADGWWLRQDIIWHKPNPTPESVRDRCTKAHEYIFLLAKSKRYFIAPEGLKEPAAYAGQMRGGSTNRYEQNAAGMDCKVYDTRNKRSVWSVQTRPYNGAHFATFPAELVIPCIKAGSRPGDQVLDPFGGSGTVGQVARDLGRGAVLCELNPEYAEMAKVRVMTPLKSKKPKGPKKAKPKRANPQQKDLFKLFG